MRFLVLLMTASIGYAETGSLTIHMILHAVGEERYEIVPSDGGLKLSTTFEYSDRGNKRTTQAALMMGNDYTPVRLEVRGKSPVIAADGSFPILGASPFAVQMMMVRYWNAHGRPARLPVQIRAVGHETITVEGKKVGLDRYTIADLMFGREILWMNERGDLAAAMTFAGGLPMEAVRTEYEPALPQLYRSGVAQEMADLEAIGRSVPPERTGAFAIVGARLLDATGAAPVENSVVIVRDGRIAAVGAGVAVPKGMPVIEAKGQTLLPGLWEMHIHASGVEFGPALLAAGITTARDCGGEFDYLVAARDAVAKRGAIGPRLLLAGLVDAGGLKAFGHVTAETPEEGRAVVDRYHAAGFQQIKLYTFLQPDVIRAIASEAHKLGMTVTGHVPQVFNAFEGVEAGMDQINHLNYVTSVMRPAGAGRGAVDVNSEAAQKAIQFFKDHRTVIDPTAGWGEMAGHSKEVDVASFEPGIAKAPVVLETKFRGMGGTATAEQMNTRMAQTLAIIGALHKAGVVIVPGSDTGLVGFGLHRELELYVQAGMTPMEAIQSGTIVSARAMQLDRDSGTIEAGKRADLILVNGDPLTNISDLRKVTRVVANGRVFGAGQLWESVGFQP
jgi:imidazolonepropionase-like amidohydrolase